MAPGDVGEFERTDSDRSERWWNAHPDDNIGLATGFKFDVLDIDVAKDKPGSLNARRAEKMGLLTGWVAMQNTPSGGKHLLYLPDDDLTNTVNSKLGLDVRAKGGYIVAAPSVVDGNRYEWVMVSDGPYGLLRWSEIRLRLDPPPPRREFTGKPSGDIAPLVTFVAEAPQGERNSRLFWAACRAIEGGHDPLLLLDAALSIGLSDIESKATIRSARPRSIA
jgi:hypothetical protein